MVPTTSKKKEKKNKYINNIGTPTFQKFKYNKNIDEKLSLSKTIMNVTLTFPKTPKTINT